MHIWKLARSLKRRALYRHEGPRIIRANYQHFFGKELTGNPTTLTEKITHWMISLHKRNDPIFTRLADKFLARAFVEERVGKQHLVDLLWHGTDPANIPFDELPDRCMAKTNHASGTNLVLERPLDPEDIIRKFNKWLGMNYYFVGRELQYKHIKPRILIERFIDDGSPGGPLSYRFWCFGGKPEFIKIDNDSHSINLFLDLNWKMTPFYYKRSVYGDAISTLEDVEGMMEFSRLENFEKMVEIASTLSSGFDFVRVDMYNSRGRIIVGELTFTPVSGLFKLEPLDWDAILGEKWL